MSNGDGNGHHPWMIAGDGVHDDDEDDDVLMVSDHGHGSQPKLLMFKQKRNANSHNATTTASDQIDSILEPYSSSLQVASAHNNHRLYPEWRGPPSTTSSSQYTSGCFPDINDQHIVDVADAIQNDDDDDDDDDDEAYDSNEEQLKKMLPLMNDAQNNVSKLKQQEQEQEQEQISLVNKWHPSTKKTPNEIKMVNKTFVLSSSSASSASSSTPSSSATASVSSASTTITTVAGVGGYQTTAFNICSTTSSPHTPQQPQQLTITASELLSAPASTSSDQQHLVQISATTPSTRIQSNSTENTTRNITSFTNTAIIAPSTSSSSRLMRFCQNLTLKMAIGAFLFILVISIYQSFLILTFKCDRPNNSTSKSPMSTFSAQNYRIAATAATNMLPKLSSSSSATNKRNESVTSMSPSYPGSSSEESSHLEPPEEYLDTENRSYSWKDVRLPAHIRPKYYELFMNPDIETLVNIGNVSIDFMIYNVSSRFVIVHVKKLTIHDLLVLDLTNPNNKINVVKYQECLKLEQLYIELDQHLPPSKNGYRLQMSFSRKIEDQLEGFYVSSYFNERKKQNQRMLTTHFEPTLARTAFPCFDEPAMKASFRLMMAHDQGYDVYFNTEKVHEHHQLLNGVRKIITEFEPTVPMSTYLVAFIVSDFSMVNIDPDSGSTRIGALVPVGQEANARFALNATKHILAYFENFFKIPYPLKKLDVVAVPDFGAGAMENWGLITFRMTTLLYNEKDSSSEVKEQIAIVVAHEVAHQWFGNLVTMDWWNDLWLNEGFASFVENLGVDHIHPEWRMLDQFVISTSQQALALDSLLSSHAINTTVVNPADIEGIFDLISYKKGSCLIRMIVGFLGLENLQHGLEKYLNRYKYRTAKTSQLWESFSETSVSLPVNVSAIMDTWILQQGYPLISVGWSAENQIYITQQPFISSLGPEEFESKLLEINNGSQVDHNDQQTYEQLKQTWIIPLTFITPNHSNDEESTVHWLQTKSMHIQLNRNKNPWFKLNRNQSGFYRTNYQVSMWLELITMLIKAKPDQHPLSPSDRAGLIDDALSLMRIGYIDVDIAMNLTRYLEYSEQDYVPWETMLSQVGIIDSIMPQNPMFHRYILRLIQPMVNQLSWDERKTDGLFEKKLRAIMLRAAVYYGHQPSINQAKKYFNDWMYHNVQIPANIRDIVYSAGVEHGTDVEWNHCWRKYLNTTVASEKRLLLGVLGATRNSYLLSNYLQFALNRSQIRTQDTYFVIQNVARNPIGRDMAWKFLRANWQKIFEMLGLGSFALDTIISETTWHFSTQFDYKEVEDYFSKVPVGSGKQAMRQSLEKIRANIYWKQKIEPKLMDWLKRFFQQNELGSASTERRAIREEAMRKNSPDTTLFLFEKA